MNGEYYRGYDSRYGIFDSEGNELYTWLTDDYDYAKEYAKSIGNYGKVSLIKVNCNDNEIGSVLDIPEEIDFYDIGDEYFKEYILDKGLKGYEFYANDDESYCLCVSKEVCEVLDDNYMRDIEEKLSPVGYEPKQKGIAYKVFRVKNGKLYPPMVANNAGEDTPIGVWLDAEEGEFAGLSKTGRPQVKSIGSGNLSYRPGWHLGDIPRAKQFDRLNKETGEYEFPKDFVWAECEYTMDVDYQPESDARGYERTKVDDNGNVTTYRSNKYQHSLAGVPHLPTNGYYRYRTNPNPDTVPWVITGQMKVNRLLSDNEVNNILQSKGIEPIHRQGGDKTLNELGLQECVHSGVAESLLRRMNEDDETQDYNELLNTVYALSHIRDAEDGDIPAYCFLHEITDIFGFDDEEVIDVVTNNGYKIIEVVGNDEIDGCLIVADKDCSTDMIKSDYERFYDVDVDVKELKHKEERHTANESVENKENTNVIKIQVFVEPKMEEGLPTGKIEDMYDEQTLEDWYDFAATIEGIIEKNGETVNIQLSKNEKSLSEYIDFYTLDENGNRNPGMIDLRLSDHPQTQNARRIRKKKAEKKDPDYVLKSVIVNEKTFNSYDEAIQYIRELFNMKKESLSEDTVKTRNGKWTNKGKEGTHGTFKTKKQADAQRRAMFSNGFNEEFNNSIMDENIEKHDTLNQKLWNEDNTLKEEVREKILQIVKEFTDGLAEDGIKFKLDDIRIVGSNCSYNYNDKSDLDIHLIMDTKSLECPDNLYPLLYSAYRSLFNNKLNIEFYGIPVEIFVETNEESETSEEDIAP